MLYRGSCHCGKIAFEVEGELEAAVACNCSICAKRGSLLWAVPHDKLRLRAAAEDLGSYSFNRHVFAHRFCKTCGIHTHAEDAAPKAERSAPEAQADRMSYINIRCLDGLDLAGLPVIEFDGRSV